MAKARNYSFNISALFFTLFFFTFYLTVPAGNAFSAENSNSGKKKGGTSSKSWKGYVIDIEKDGVIWINAGKSQGAAAGYRFEALGKGKEMKDPSGKTYTLPGKRKAILEVVESLEKISSVIIVEGGDLKKGDMIRFLSAAKTPAGGGEAATGVSAGAVEEIEGFFREGIIIEADPKKGKGIISIGARQGLKRGDKLAVVRMKDRIVDPNTGELIRVKQELVGALEVISSGKTVSDVKFIKNARSIRKGDSVRRHTSAPASVEAKPIGFRKIEIGWKLQSEPETKSFNVYRSQSSEGPFEIAGKVKSGEAVMFVDKHSSRFPMGDSETYYYKVSTINSINQESPKSKVVSVQSMGAPEPPEGLTAESGAIRSVPLKWRLHANGELAGYRIYRSKTRDGPYEMIADIKSRKDIEYSDRNGGSTSNPKLEDSTTYYYSISAYSPFGDEGVKSDPVAGATSDPPAVPTGFEGKGWQALKVPLTWEIHPDENVRGYIIYRASEEEGPYVQINEIKRRKRNSYVDGGESGMFSKKGKLENYHLYYYKIKAYNWVKAKSDMSEAISVMTRPVPAPPENLKAAGARPREIPIVWRKSPDIKIKAYQVFRSLMENGVFKKIGEVTSDKAYYLDEKLKDDTTYFYKIRAIDKDKLEGEFSEVVSATTKKLPDVVRGLKWSFEGERAVLQWDKNSEIDIEKYIIYKKGLFGWKKAGSGKENSFALMDLKKGSSADYAVSALDADKLEGKRSDPLTVNLP